MNMLPIKRYFSPCLCVSLLMYHTGCVCSAHKELNKKSAETKNIQPDLYLQEKTISELLDRLSQKDQEIGRLTDELHNARVIIKDLKSDIEKLREIDVQVEEKKKEVDSSMAETITVNTQKGTPKTEPTAPGESNGE